MASFVLSLCLGVEGVSGGESRRGLGVARDGRAIMRKGLKILFSDRDE